MGFLYFAYGIVVESDLELPELVSVTEGKADLTIRMGPIDWSPPPSQGPGNCVVVDVGKIYFFWPEAGKFVAQNGREIIFDPLAHADERLLRILILSAVLSGVLHQRGLLLLHASALRLGNNALVFMGEKGEGKSTLAASMQIASSNNFQMLADDVVAVSISDSVCYVLPGFPQFRLWPDAFESFGLRSEELTVLHPHLEKRAYRAVGNFVLDPVPLRNVYVLDSGPEQDIRVLNAKEGFIELARYSYLGRHVGKTGLVAQHFNHCTQIANSVPIALLRRPRSLQGLPGIATLIADHMDQIESGFSASRCA